MEELIRIAVVGIVIEEPQNDAAAVNSILSTYSGIIRGRMGLNFPEKKCGVISVVVQATPDEIGALTGKLGRLASVSVKSAMTAKNI